ncbi:F0F1 ATP synthase subunit alpha [Buchnera aphidicola (Taiwanaphis decaspermi)]|uniref:F0F1 ATP synthase subunit alpha n=1 Tax=Buchnera aphidicola TaxID=9 RepID=UPI0031B84D7E
MKIDVTEISNLIKKKIKNFNISKELYDEGEIISISDGIITIYGLSNVMQGEMLNLPNNKYAVALNLELDSVSAIVLDNCNDLTEGMKVKCTGKMLEIPIGDKILGRVINSLGYPIDGKGEIINNGYYLVENEAPEVIDREPINQPLQTGYKSIDTMIPIGKGQRELIIGDRQTGKTTLAIDTIINQKNNNVKCIYVAIGQKMSTINDIVQTLEEHNSLSHTTIVVSSASDPASLQYISPYTGCTIGEYFRDKGEDALVVYDDLSKHAIAYRQISLLLRRPPGREAFPGDVFYLHSRLLERSSRVNSKYIEKITKGKIKNRTGSLTSLPIIETQAGDVSSFVPTNVISITDGQIFLESNLFNSGIKPAINPGISVSRVGNSAQTNIIKKLSGNIRTSLAQFRELSSFAQFSSDLDKITKKQLINGNKITNLLKQYKNKPMCIAEQSLILFAIKYNFLDDINICEINNFEYLLLRFFKKKYILLINEINLKGEFNDIIKNKFIKIITKFKKNLDKYK